MSSIHRTENGTWRIRWREGDRQRSKTVKTKAEAQAFQEEVRQKSASGRVIQKRRDVPTLEDFALDWLAARTDLEPSTERLYLSWMKAHVFPCIGHLHLVDLRPRRLYEWQQERLDSGAGPSTIGKTQALLSQIFDAAILPHEWIDSNPILALKRPKYQKRQHRWLSASQVEGLRVGLLRRGDLAGATLLSVLAYVGIRPQDALALEWSHVGEKLTVIQKNANGVISPGSKTGDRYRRAVYLPAPVAADLEEWRREAPEWPLIFGRPKDGRPWTKDDVDNFRNRRFRPSALDAGLGRDLRPYDLRHTAASLYAAAGWNHLEIARQLGHSPEESVRTYQHLLDQSQGRDRRTIDEWILEARADSVPDLFPIREHEEQAVTDFPRYTSRARQDSNLRPHAPEACALSS